MDNDKQVVSEMKYRIQQPQNVIGWIISRFCRHDGNVYRTRFRIGVALGEYIIVNEEASETTINHERGHVLQSRLLGPLYLIVVGLPSITMNILTRLGVLRIDMYYKRWPESWADKLGGVDRD